MPKRISTNLRIFITNTTLLNNLKKIPFLQNDLSICKMFVFVENVEKQKISSPEKLVFW